jgi:dTDP-4-amino-4,6-dideoxygalactose transaminase
MDNTANSTVKEDHMKVPLLDLSVQNGEMKQKIRHAIDDVLESQKFILGPHVQQLENRVADYCGAKYAVGVSSGTDALLVSLMALDIAPGDEVVTTPYTFFATAGAVARLGAKPVFVDIDPDSYNINPNLVEKAFTKKTKALLPVHLYGQCADIEPLMRIAKKYSLPVIEDAAQALGSEYRDGKRAGSMGLIGCFSFFPSKNLGAIGDAGIVVTDNADMAEKIRILRTHGSNPKYFHKYVGGNFRLDTIQAAVLDVKLDYLDGWTKLRQENAERYENLFKASGLCEKGEITLPPALYKKTGVKHYHIYNQFVVRAKNRDGLREFLKDNDIGTEIYYPVSLHLQECFASLGYTAGDFPESERASRETLALPIYPGLTVDMQKYVVDKIGEFYAQKI